jgi:hypothetical protein
MLRGVATGARPSWLWSSAALGTLGVVALAACVDPNSDYNAFLLRTADAMPTLPADDASLDGASPEVAFSGTYVMACVSEVEDSDPRYATYFWISAAFRPAASGGGGTFDFSDQALTLGPGSPPAPPTSISTTERVGDIVTVDGSVVSPDGRCDVVFGPTVVPGAADAVVPMQDIDFTNSTLHFVIGPGSHLCAELGGAVTSPLIIPALTPAKNICALTATDGPVMPMTQADVHCP